MTNDICKWQDNLLEFQLNLKYISFYKFLIYSARFLNRLIDKWYNEMAPENDKKNPSVLKIWSIGCIFILEVTCVCIYRNDYSLNAYSVIKNNLHNNYQVPKTLTGSLKVT